MKQPWLRQIYWRLTGIIMLILMLALGASSWFSHNAFERSLVPEMAKKAATVGASVRLLMLKAVELGIPYRDLYAVDLVFAEVREETPDFDYFAATDTQGNVLFQKGRPADGVEAYFRSPSTLALLGTGETRTDAVRVDGQYMVSVPILSNGTPLGMLHVGIDGGFVDHIILELLFDVVVILVVALFFTLELLNFIAGTRLENGLRSLAGILERGRSGDFTVQPVPGSNQEFSGVLRLLVSTADRVNAGFMALTRDIEAARRDPAHDRRDGLNAAAAGLHVLTQKFRFGTAPVDAPGDDSRLAQVRAPLFAFILAEELTRSFLPSYVTELLVPIPGLSAQVVVGLPIVLFMLIVALGQPHLGAFSERVGHRKAMFYGAAIAAAGFFATALAASVLDLLLWRGLCAVGYALVFVAAQAYVLQHTSLANRARGFALFVGAIMVATICGPSIGGILADNIGSRTTFMISALLALASILAIRMLPEPGPNAAAVEHAGAPRMADIVALMFNRRFMALTGLAAMPAKIILTGICFYLVPLYVVSVGATQAMAGRILMVYAVVMVLMSPVAAGLAGTRMNRERLVGAGLCISGLGGLLMLFSGSVAWVSAAVLVIGLGQSLSITAQSALVSDHCQAEIARLGEHTVYGVYRLLERIGNALGPLIAAGLVVWLGFQSSFIVIGALAAVCGIAFLLSTQAGSAPAYATAE